MMNAMGDDYGVGVYRIRYDGTERLSVTRGNCDSGSISRKWVGIVERLYLKNQLGFNVCRTHSCLLTLRRLWVNLRENKHRIA